MSFGSAFLYRNSPTEEKQTGLASQTDHLGHGANQNPQSQNRKTL
jgi:hypothetical protein